MNRESKAVKRYAELRDTKNMTESIDVLVEELARERAIGVLHWKEQVFKPSYKGYILKDYKSVKKYPGLLYGEQYSLTDIYDKYLIYHN